MASAPQLLETFGPPAREVEVRVGPAPRLTAADVAALNRELELYCQLRQRMLELDAQQLAGERLDRAERGRDLQAKVAGWLWIATKACAVVLLVAVTAFLVVGIARGDLTMEEVIALRKLIPG